MYAGALDERFGAVAPVCSVGAYKAYLRAACCVCEVLPGALRFCEEGDVLALAAPRALLVVSATKDAFQFSVGEAEKSIARARPVFKLHGAEEKLRHAVFESPHDYNKAMREAMYGWMTRWLKNEGDGKPIAEPAHKVEKPEDLACFPGDERPRAFLFPPSLAGREARALVAKQTARPPEHAEDWESTAVYLRAQLRKQVFGDFPKLPRPDAKVGETATAGGVAATPVLLHPEPGMPVPAILRRSAKREGPGPGCILLHLDGKAEALKHPLAEALLDRGWAVLAPDLRGTGETQPAGGAIRGAPDHNSAEHALWVGRPLLGQWVFDVLCLLDWLALQQLVDRRRLAVAGIGQAGMVALCAAGVLDDRVASAAVLDGLASYVTDEPYAAGTRMGLLAPGILKVGDVPRLAALVAPRPLVVAGGVSAQGENLPEKGLMEAYAFTRSVYTAHKAAARLTVRAEMKPQDIAAGL
jgi:pimeloyl-ACP methyl ester carboxylesterase